MKWLVGQFAILQGQLVKITRIRRNYHRTTVGPFEEIQVKFINDTLHHWIKPEYLQPLKHQVTAKILFSK